ncbi:MAG: hypothetical protein K1X79_00305 [Oligoflexia bacterium]|nr:hypothetical protein [Oligoflexia bacterium]
MTSPSRGAFNTATLVLTAFAFACAGPREAESAHAAEPQAPAISKPDSQPTQAPEKFSRYLRRALQETHDQTADNAFSAAVLSGKITPAQYNLMVRQNLFVFECFENILAGDKSLPEDIRGRLLQDLRKISAGFREDLGLASTSRLNPQDALPSTAALMIRLQEMPALEVAVCAYQDIGGMAFGTHTLAEKANTLGIKNTRGYTLYEEPEFRTLAGLMNASITDPAQYAALAASAKAFYDAHDRMSNAPEFQVN